MYLDALLFTLIPIAAAAFSGLVVTIHTPRKQVTSAVQHLAAGVVFAAAAIELVPGVLHSAPGLRLSSRGRLGRGVWAI